MCVCGRGWVFCNTGCLSLTSILDLNIDVITYAATIKLILFYCRSTIYILGLENEPFQMMTNPSTLFHEFKGDRNVRCYIPLVGSGVVAAMEKTTQKTI